MPNRLLREGINSSERVNVLDWEAEVFYRRLMSAVDDFGRFWAHPAMLRATLYPLKLETVREANMERLLRDCEKARLVRLYEVDGKRYLELLDFRQQVRAKQSKYPNPPACAADATQMLSTCAADAQQMRTKSESESESESETKAQSKSPPDGGNDDDFDEADAFIAALLNENERLSACNYGPRQQSKARKLFQLHGPERTRECIGIAIDQGAEEPWSYALGIAQKADAKKAGEALARRPAARAKLGVTRHGR